MELHDVDAADAYDALLNRDGLGPSTPSQLLFSSQAQEWPSIRGPAWSLMADLGDQDDNLDDRSIRSELLDSSSTVSRGSDHEASMQKSFSPLAGLALGFRYISSVAGEEHSADATAPAALPIHGLDILARLGRTWHMLVLIAWFLAS